MSKKLESTAPAPREAENFMANHPQQRLQSPGRGTSAMIHAIGLACFAYSYKFLIDNPSRISLAFGWHFQYLTVIGLALATITFAFGLLADTLSSDTFFVTKNVFGLISTPMAVLITILYFGLSLLDKSLVVPADLTMPIQVDLSMHLAPAALLVLDALLLSPPWVISLPPAIGLAGFFGMLYWLWIEVCFSQNDFYPYPLFEKLSPQQRIFLFMGAAVLMGICTMAIVAVHAVINPDRRKRDAYGRLVNK